MPYAPDIPTFIEGGVADYEAYTWHMAMVPAGTPMPVVNAINAAFNRALAVPAVQQRLGQMLMNVTTDSTPESAARFLASEMAKWTPVIRGAGIRPS
jgi:tripartite-type tricarboxylate transporter receptor subunit TctC